MSSRPHMPLHPSLPVTVFAFAGENGLLYGELCRAGVERDAGTDHCSWLLTRNGEVLDNGGQNKKGVLYFLCFEGE